MNPYESPRSKSAPASQEGTKPSSGGPYCPECGGNKLGRDLFARNRPNLFEYVIFGLFAVAFTKISLRCEDCGTISRHRSAGSKLGMALLIGVPIIYWFIRAR